MKAEMELNQNAVEILLDMVKLSDEFIDDHDGHSLKGIKEFVNRRKKILSGFENPAGEMINSKSRFAEVKKILVRCKKQDQTIEGIVKKLQKDLVDSVNQMKRIKKSMSGYKSKLIRTPRFIDKKR